MPDPRATPDRLRVIAQTIEAWMRSDGFAHRHADVIWSGEDLVPVKAADCAHFIEQALHDRAAIEVSESAAAWIAAKAAESNCSEDEVIEALIRSWDDECYA